MEIDILELRNNLLSYEKAIDDYNQTLKQIYNDINYLTEYMTDEKIKKMLIGIDLEISDINKEVLNLTTIRDIYCFIIKLYENYGKKIFVDFSYFDTVNTKFDKVVDEMNSLITISSKYSLDNNKYKEKIIFIRNDIELLKSKVNKNIAKLKEKEENIASKISKVVINIAQKKDETDYI